MSKRIIESKTSVEITEVEYFQLLGLRAVYEKLIKERNIIMKYFANITNLTDDNDDDWYYEKGSYILQDNEGETLDLKSTLKDSGITIVTE